MSRPDWEDGSRRGLGLYLSGDNPQLARRGDDLLMLFHSGHWDEQWQLPGSGVEWEVVLDTNAPKEPEGTRTVASGAALTVTARSVVVLRRVRR